MLTVDSFSENDARSVAQWRYEKPYDVYDCPPWQTVAASHWGLADSTRRANEFFAVREEGLLIGYFRLVRREDSVAAGLGLKPECCGKGLGGDLMQLLLSAAFERYPNLPIRLEVRSFNERARRCYARAGFRTVSMITHSAPGGEALFIQMEHPGR